MSIKCSGERLVLGQMSRGGASGGGQANCTRNSHELPDAFQQA